MNNDRLWSSFTNSPRLNTWRGIAFETLCLCHIGKIKQTLGIADVATHVCSWRGEWAGDKVQVDLLIDRNDQTINLCEIKFSNTAFLIDKSYAEKLQKKVNIFLQETGTLKTILLTLIASAGLVENTYSSIVQREVTLNNLF